MMTLPTSDRRRFDTGVLVGLVVVAVSAVLYWLADRSFDAGRGDFFYLADAFLHGRTWLTFRPGPNDVIIIDGRIYVPFAPFPALVFMPLVAVIGAVTADQLESGIDAVLAAACVGLCWMLLARIGVRRLVDRLALTILFGFSTQILWVTTRGGVWHTGQLIATILTLVCLIEVWGRQRAWLVGLFAGAAFLTRAPLAFAIPFYGLLLDPRPVLPTSEVLGGYIPSVARSTRLRAWLLLAAGVAPAIVVFLLYNQVRFGSPWESGYGLATLPPFLEAQRAIGPVRAGAHPDEPRLLPLPPAVDHPDLPVFQAGRAGAVGAADESGAPVRHPGRLATPARLVAGGRRGRRR